MRAGLDDRSHRRPEPVRYQSSPWVGAPREGFTARQQLRVKTIEVGAGKSYTGWTIGATPVNGRYK